MTAATTEPRAAAIGRDTGGEGDGAVSGELWRAVFGEQQRPVEFALHDPLRGLQIQRGQQFIGTFDIGGGADDMIDPADPLEQRSDLRFLRDIDRDRGEGRSSQLHAGTLQLVLAPPGDDHLCAGGKRAFRQRQAHSGTAADDEDS